MVTLAGRLALYQALPTNSSNFVFGIYLDGARLAVPALEQLSSQVLVFNVRSSHNNQFGF